MPEHVAYSYPEAATVALDRINEFGEARILNVDDVEACRKAIRAEARRRKQRVTTHAVDDDFVIASAPLEHESVEARAYNAVAVPYVMENMLTSTDGPLLDVSLRTIVMGNA